MEDMFFWLTSSNQHDMSSLKMNTKRKAAQVNLEGKAVWFTESEEKEARLFLRDLKYCMHYLYCCKYGKADRATWMNNDWLNKFD